MEFEDKIQFWSKWLDVKFSNMLNDAISEFDVIDRIYYKESLVVITEGHIPNNCDMGIALNLRDITYVIKTNGNGLLKQIPEELITLLPLDENSFLHATKWFYRRTFPSFQDMFKFHKKISKFFINIVNKKE